MYSYQRTYITSRRDGTNGAFVTHHQPRREVQDTVRTVREEKTYTTQEEATYEEWTEEKKLQYEGIEIEGMTGASESEKRLAVQKYIAQYEMFERFFREADEDNSGELNIEELIQIVKSKGYKGSEASIRGAFSRADITGDGLISFEEYMLAMGFKLQKHHKGLLLWRAMRDHTSDRHIKYVSLLKVLSQTTKHFNIQDHQLIKQTSDRYRNGSDVDSHFFILDLNRQRIISTASLPAGDIPPEVYIRFAELHGDVIDGEKTIIRQEATVSSTTRTEVKEWTEVSREEVLRWLETNYKNISPQIAFGKMFREVDIEGRWAVPVDKLTAHCMKNGMPHVDKLDRCWRNYELIDGSSIGYDQFMHSLNFTVNPEQRGYVLWSTLWPLQREELVDYWLALHMANRLAPHLDEEKARLTKSAVERCRVDRKTVDLVLFLLELERLQVIDLDGLPDGSITSQMRQKYAQFQHKLDQMKMLTSYQLHGFDDETAHTSYEQESQMFEEWVEEKKISYETSSQSTLKDGFSLDKKYSGLSEYDLYVMFFREADRDNSGELDVEEVITKLRRSGYNGSEDTIRRAFKGADLSGSGMISFEEYITAMGHTLNPTDKALRFYREMKKVSPDLQLQKADLLEIVEKAAKYFPSSKVAEMKLAVNKVTNDQGIADGWLFLLRLSDLGLISLDGILAGEMPLDARKRLDIITGQYKEQETTEEWTVEQKIQYERTELELTQAPVFDEYDLYVRFFEEADVDGSGELEIEELIAKLRKEGYKGSEQTIRSAFRRADTSGTGEISLEEYLVAVGFTLREKHKGQKFWTELVRKAGGKLVLNVTVIIQIVETVSRYFKASDSIEMKRTSKKIQDSNGDVDYHLLMLILEDEGVVSTELLPDDAITAEARTKFDNCEYPGGERRLARLEREKQRKALREKRAAPVVSTQGSPNDDYDAYERYFRELDRDQKWAVDALTIANKLRPIGGRGADVKVQNDFMSRARSADKLVKFSDYMKILGFQLKKTTKGLHLYHGLRERRGTDGVLMTPDDITAVCQASSSVFDAQDITQMSHVTKYIPRVCGDYIDYRQWLREVEKLDIIDLSELPSSVMNSPVSEAEIQQFSGGIEETVITQTTVTEQQTSSGSGYSTGGRRVYKSVIDVTPTQEMKIDSNQYSATTMPLPKHEDRALAPPGDSRTFVDLRLKLHYLTKNPGHALAVVGSLSELGAWNPRNAVLASQDPADSGWWHAKLTVPADTYFEWKWIVVPWTKDQVIRWENDPAKPNNQESSEGSNVAEKWKPWFD